MRIIYGICSWGLGHATRSLPVIRKLIQENNDLTIISNGRSLQLLQRELGNAVKYLDIPDYPILISNSSSQFIAKSMIYWPLFIKRIQSGLSKLTKILKNKRYDLIFSDGRYDIYNTKIPSFFISHQIRIMNPLRIKFFEYGSELFNTFFFKRFCGVMVPDYHKDNFSGDLSHNLKMIDEKKLFYVGILSDFKKRKVVKNIDYLISLSGPEPQRTLLEKNIISQIQGLSGNIAITLGKTEEQKEIMQDNVQVYSFLTKENREELMNRAKMVISRSGYSTIMDLAVLETKALMIPTPGQIEQEYLARFLTRKGIFYSVNQNQIQLKKDISRAQKTQGVLKKYDVTKTVENILQVATSQKKSPFR
jgi:uncharacterized protein (TIGR00661 family)